MVSMKVTKMDGNFTAEEMYSYLENFLGETARAMWESYKLNCPTDFQQDISLGVNLYNFTNRMKIMILGSNPNMGFNAQQKEAIRKLEIIQIKNWKYIKPFLQDYLYYACKAGGYHDQALGERLFLKLPAPIGHEIHQAWNMGL